MFCFCKEAIVTHVVCINKWGFIYCDSCSCNYSPVAFIILNKFFIFSIHNIIIIINRIALWGEKKTNLQIE